ncbi:Hydrogenase-4 component F [Mucinivorans hirudinis]|uniref:Hydrogenase-4 component F n=1 Tax=Mucinivorans hirudinis TaxID=1433126 RepID=A0A060R961_9BACT|nr:Hydrogenase-4 component F [Mucinivorans hirudinis]
MLIIIVILAAICCTTTLLAKSKKGISLPAAIFFATLVCCSLAAAFGEASTELWFFNFDKLGITYLVLTAMIGVLTVVQSAIYLDEENIRQLRIYYCSLVALAIALIGVFLSNNITVTWIFLEATTLAAAALTYHRRSVRSLEATWKYIFISSVGIAIAYLGILMLGASLAKNGEMNLSYDSLKTAVAGGNSLYLKLSFIFILAGYTAKMELFPLFTVGVDANHAAPAPAAAFISSAMVAGGFVAIYRVYGVMSGNGEVFGWVRSVLLIAGVLSLLVAAVYMGRTQNYKRLFAYSTVENSGLTILGLGIGGIGVWAALLHSLAHTVIKSVVFLQLSDIGKRYGTYKIGKIGDYFAVNRFGSLVLMLGFIGLVAMPPSLLFRSEYMMLTELIQGSRWWLIFPIALFLIAIVYWLCAKVLPIFTKPIDRTRLIENPPQGKVVTWVLLAMMLALFFFGFVSTEWLTEFIGQLVIA